MTYFYAGDHQFKEVHSQRYPVNLNLNNREEDIGVFLSGQMFNSDNPQASVVEKQQLKIVNYFSQTKVYRVPLISVMILFK